MLTYLEVTMETIKELPLIPKDYNFPFKLGIAMTNKNKRKEQQQKGCSTIIEKNMKSLMFLSKVTVHT